MLLICLFFCILWQYHTTKSKSANSVKISFEICQTAKFKGRAREELVSKTSQFK